MFLIAEYQAATVRALRGNPTQLDLPRTDFIKHYFVDRDAAMQGVKDLATKNPMRQFALFEPTAIFETTTPNIIEKQLNEQGEVVLKVQS